MVASSLPGSDVLCTGICCPGFAKNFGGTVRTITKENFSCPPLLRLSLRASRVAKNMFGTLVDKKHTK